MKKFFMVAVAAMSLTAIQAVAAPLYGTVGFSGNIMTPVNGGANSITFVSLPSVTSPEGAVTASTGAFTQPFLTDVQTPVLQLGPGVVGYVFNFGPTLGSAYTFTVSGFSGATLVSNVPGEGSRSILLFGEYARGADSSLGTLRISFQNPQTGNPSTYSADGSSIPEPATYAMLGSALLGLGLLRRRKA